MNGRNTAILLVAAILGSEMILSGKIQAIWTALWSGPTRVFLWTDQEDPRELGGKQHFLFARSGGKAIFTNREP